uniref:Deoxyribonuclease TATDN3 n=1 Tax=Acrobeloides nanus TaxID=290746 RepID=A0A914DUQ0_9BILA
MIDCHCHLADDDFDADIDEVVSRAKEANVKAVIVCAEFSSQFQKILDLSKKYPGFCKPALGIHPVQKMNISVSWDDFEGVEYALRKHSHEICAIGEVGLDFTPRYLKKDNDKQIQRDILQKQIELSKELDLPLNVHSRSAGRPVIDFLIENSAQKVLLHAFSGNVKNAEPGIKAGYYFSIPPSFSIKPTEKTPLIKAIPIDQICLETDSPVLGPVRTERNEPKNIGISAKFIADVKGIPIEEVIHITTQNALRLFK